MTKQSTVEQPKTSNISHQPKPVFASQKLAGFAEFAQICGTTPTRNRDGDTSYFGTDILGSVRSVTDKYGNVKASYEYDAFGTPYLSNLENEVGFGYTGKVYDSATGLYDYGFRDYAPVSARFTTVDPVRDGNNWFAYVVNDPVNYIDPFGLTPSDAGNNVVYGPITYEESLSQESLNAMNDLKSGDPIRINIASNNRTYQTTVIVLRQHNSTGDVFDSDRYVYKDDGITKDIVYHDKIGANCAPDFENTNCFTEPDGVYYYTTDGLINNGDGTFDSKTYHNVLKHQTNDTNISKDIRDKINNNPADFLDHANQRKIDKNGPYRNNELPRSAGCTIGKDGQIHQDEYMHILKAGVDNVEDITKIIHSYTDGDR